MAGVIVRTFVSADDNSGFFIAKTIFHNIFCAINFSFQELLISHSTYRGKGAAMRGPLG